ncbi:hypothetical protein F3Y22_tig00110597pilonHSYRG00041 [Hibiscus syriacus]|uniref:Reverse transcriptase zinc-binding domain-containing protein n=1 Tax=Hibiscus syriacus TaxID=106335 RepID=A0A6A3A2D7_HIBSY|nr:hypothetical protein F3Y22_tig00110597pilonHSYRG00041 [Hibiscus syriacus]
MTSKILCRAVSIASVPSTPILARESTSHENHESTYRKVSYGSASIPQYNGRRRQKFRDSAQGISIQVLEKFSLVTRFAQETSSQLFRETHRNIFLVLLRRENLTSLPLIIVMNHLMMPTKFPFRALLLQILLRYLSVPSVKSELIKRGIQGIEDDLCPLCKLAEENSTHLFFTCSVAWSLWNKFLNFWRFSFVFPADAITFLIAWDELKANSAIWTFIPVAIIWTIWKTRNFIVFEGGKLDQIELFFLSRVRLASWFLAKNKDVSIHKDSLITDPSLADSYSPYSLLKFSSIPWVPPPAGFFKLNVDAAISNDWKKSSIGGIWRDHSGTVLGFFQESAGPGPPTLLELKAIQRGISFFASAQGEVKDRLIVESDSRVAVNWINNVDSCPVVYAFVVRNIVDNLRILGGWVLLAVVRVISKRSLGNLMPTSILVVQKEPYRKHIHDDEAATNVGNFELISYKEWPSWIQKGEWWIQSFKKKNILRRSEHEYGKRSGQYLGYSYESTYAERGTIKEYLSQTGKKVYEVQREERPYRERCGKDGQVTLL